jgi:NDP-sugar pyrophosphorylase family protein
MALIPNPRPDKYGGVSVSASGWVTGFTGKGTATESYHFIGVQIAERAVFASLEDGVASESVNSLYRSLIAECPDTLFGFVCDASFRDVGTPADYLHTSVELAAREGDRLAAGSRIARADSARIVRSALWDDVVIGRGAELVECIVCDRVRIPDGARYERCAIVPASDAGGFRLEPGAGERIDGDLLVSPFRP